MDASLDPELTTDLQRDPLLVETFNGGRSRDRELTPGLSDELLAPPGRGEAGPRDYRRRLSFDFSIVAAAQKHYAGRGYEDIPVPWVISRQAMDSTLPSDKVPYETFGGYLVGSAEQSFIELLLSGETLGRVQATTPCFRDEAHDGLHSPYFLKTELFDGALPLTEESVLAVAEDAGVFFENYIPVKLERQGPLAWDLVHAETGVEVGSYGVREVAGHSWIYGTGVALPRLQQTMDSTHGHWSATD